MRKTLTLVLAVLAVGDMEVPGSSLSVAAGDTLYGLPARLGIDVADWRWKAYIRLEHDGSSLSAGTYGLPAGADVRRALGTVLSGVSTATDVSVTILPGWNVYDIDAALVRAGFAKPGEVSAPSAELMTGLRASYPYIPSDSLEGYLYPDTYRLDPRAGLSAALSRMLARFDEKISIPSGLSAARLSDTLNLASIVEREERDPANKAIVAGILTKRLDEGIALGADATVCYAYRLTHDACTPAFIGAHIAEPSAYNTRAKLGLPPTPISNVTDETFFATLRPQSSPYYYYLHDDTGAIRYGRTLAEHNDNRRTYLGR